MANINIDQVVTELGAFFRRNTEIVKNWIYGSENQLKKYTTPITKIKGEYPVVHSITDHVIQGFVAVWNELGETKFKANILRSYHQKVNFPITPSLILGSWLAFLYTENLSAEQMPISKYIAETELAGKVVQDLEELSFDGVYDANDLATFGKSMNGLKKILNDGKTDTDNPMYRILLTPLTDDNIVDEVTKFERGIPKRVRSSIKRIYMSTINKQRYMLKYEDLYGANTLIKSGDNIKTRLGSLEIVGFDYMDGSDDMFATPDGNFLRLIDIFDAPTVTDVQKADYKVKIFMEFWLGYGFHINQLVLVSTYSGTGSGLASDNLLYYGTE